MKRSFFYHPIVKGLLLLIFAASLLLSAFFGGRLAFMEANSVFNGPEGFYPSWAVLYGNTGLTFPMGLWKRYISATDTVYAEDAITHALISALQVEIAQADPVAPKRDGDHVYLAIGAEYTDWLRETYDKSQTNFVFRVEDMLTGEVLFSNMEDLYGDGGGDDGIVMQNSALITFYSEKEPSAVMPTPESSAMEEEPDTSALSDIETTPDTAVETESNDTSITAPVDMDAATDTAPVTEENVVTEDASVTEDIAAVTVPTEWEATTAIVEDEIPYDHLGINPDHVRRIRECVFTWGVRRAYTVDDAYSRFYEACMNDFHRVTDLVYMAIASLAVCILSFALLVFCTGRSHKKDGVRLSFIDRIPLEIVFLCKGAAIWGTAALCAVWIGVCEHDMLYYFFGYLTPQSVQEEWLCSLLGAAGVALVLLLGLLVLWCFCGLARRIRAKTLFKNTLVAHVLRLILRFLRFVWRVCKAYFSNLSLFWLWTVLFVACFLFPLLIGRGVAAVFALLLYAVICYIIWQLARVRRGAKELAEGALDRRIGTEGLFGAPKAMVEDLNRIGEGMSRAVEARMQSERFRTELITNVSHDIKTPLTSIISYTDLLAKEQPENERMREYIEVLSRQSARLKKLIEDLIDASKASSGAVPLSMETIDASELLVQVLGDYEDRFAEAELTPVLHVPEMGTHILADGAHLRRVFDNLMSNILKYSLGGTRVYLTVEEREHHVYLMFKNISKTELCIAAADLTERFVRGDASRHTEGNGLGLAIAKGLTELQGGTMNVSTDADLFRVVIVFPKNAE